MLIDELETTHDRQEGHHPSDNTHLTGAADAHLSHAARRRQIHANHGSGYATAERPQEAPRAEWFPSALAQSDTFVQQIIIKIVLASTTSDPSLPARLPTVSAALARSVVRRLCCQFTTTLVSSSIQNSCVGCAVRLLFDLEI